MTQSTENTPTAAIEFDDLLAALVAQVEAENAEVHDLPVGPVTAFPSPFAD